MRRLEGGRHTLQGHNAGHRANDSNTDHVQLPDDDLAKPEVTFHNTIPYLQAWQREWCLACPQAVVVLPAILSNRPESGCLHDTHMVCSIIPAWACRTSPSMHLRVHAACAGREACQAANRLMCTCHDTSYKSCRLCTRSNAGLRARQGCRARSRQGWLIGPA